VLLEVRDLCKRFPNGAVANDGLNLRVGSGELFGIFGPNGAGKTTLVRQLLGLLQPTSGSIHISGADITTSPQRARRLCSYQPQSAVSITGLTPRQTVETVGRFRGLGRVQVRQHSQALFSALDLEQWADTSLTNLSGGVARLVLLCAAVVAPGDLVILDEPTNDVDPTRRRRLWELVRSVADQGSAVLLVTHSVVEAERAVDRLAIVDRGRVVAQGTPAAVRADDGWLSLTVTLATTSVPPPPFLAEARQVGTRLQGRVWEGDLVVAVAWARDLRAAGLAEDFSLSPATLEEAYERLVATAAGISK
jgi:ABC-2 type transport system ATP-binding protein